MSTKINMLLDQEKPREKLIKMGEENLTDVELLSILLGSGGKNFSALELSRYLIKKYQGIGGLRKVPVNQLTAEKHIGNAKACVIKSALEISLRIENYDGRKNNFLRIKDPKDVYKFIKKDLLRKEKEYLYLLSLNSRGHLIGKDLISVGTVNEALISPREIFKLAMQRNAYSIILVHNHPSQDPTPSTEDILITRKIHEMGKNIRIQLLDHVIATDNSYASLKESNQI